jgi:hypothetical protein
MDNSFDESTSVEEPTSFQQILYYLSFILLFATLAFIASLLMMGYEDRTGSLLWKSNEMKLSDKIGLITFYVLQFPLGLLFGLFTGNYNSGLFAFLLNTLLIAWTLQKFLIKAGRRNIKKTFQINYGIWTALILTIIVYIATE